MTTHAALLPPTRSHKSRRAIRWTPADPAVCAHDGTLEIAGTGPTPTRYEATERYVEPGFGAGRAFRLDKMAATGVSERYQVFLAADRDRSSCSCLGCESDAKRKADGKHKERSAGLACKHLTALLIVTSCWLPDPRTNPGADAGGPCDADLAAELDRMAGIADPADRRTAFHDAEIAIIDRHAEGRRAVRREPAPF